MTDWNATKWDWDNMLNLNGIELTKEGGGGGGGSGGEPRWAEEESEMGSFYPFEGGGGCVNSGSCSDLGSGLFIMSSTSAFLDSSLKGNNSGKALHFDCTSDCFGKKQEGETNTRRIDMCAATTSPSVCASIVSGETMLGLKLGKRTYFEDVCAGGSSVRTSPFSVISEASDKAGKKKIMSSNSPEVPRCQVHGCSMDLSSAKEYHRKHRVCETHTKCPKVIVGGQERRFCQQCSRFHSLFEFDEKKRSCRKRLSDHNARRRKPQSETMQFDTNRLIPSLYERRQSGGLIWNGFSQGSMKTTWDNSLGNELIQTKELLNPLDDQQQQQPTLLTVADTNKFFPSSKDASLLPFTQGFAEYTSSPGLAVAQDRALSLLSPNTWGPSCEPSPNQGGTMMPWATTLFHGVSHNLESPLKQHYHHHHYNEQGMIDSGATNEGHPPYHLFSYSPQPGTVSSHRHAAHDN